MSDDKDTIQLSEILDLVRCLTDVINNASFTPATQNLHIFMSECALEKALDKYTNKSIIRGNVSRSEFMKIFKDYMMLIDTVNELPCMGAISDVLREISVDVEYWEDEFDR